MEYEMYSLGFGRENALKDLQPAFPHALVIVPNALIQSCVQTVPPSAGL